MALAALAAIPTASAAPPRVVLTLVDPTTLLTPEPPLTAPILVEQEPHIFRQRLDSKERVRVGVDSTGRPISLTVTQRLRIIGKGDYLYSVAGPVRSVVATKDSESVPGQRQGAILWSGFSPGLRRVGSVAVLNPVHAAKVLPLRLSIAATVDGKPLVPGDRRSGKLAVDLKVVNTTQTKAPSAAARGQIDTIVHALDGARKGIYPLGGVAVTVRTPVESVTAIVEAPLVVTGEIRFRAGTVVGRPHGFRFSVELGDGRPLTANYHFTGDAVRVGAPAIRVLARPVPPERTIAPPVGKTWADAVRLDPSLDSRTLLTIAENGYLRDARAKQYDQYMGNPGPTGAGTNSADYLYVTAPRAVAAPPPSRSGGLGILGLVLIVAGGVAAACGLTVAWAQL